MIHSSEKRRDDEELANWERSKENFVPLKQGRNVHEIEANARMGKGDFLEKCERERRAHLNEIARYEGDDPLEAWMRLIKWTEQTFPTNKTEELLPVLEKCTVELQETARYQKDLRYLRVWIKYADNCQDPSDVFKFLKANDIGQTHALFYEVYGTFLEMRKAYALANEVFTRGVEMNAEPLSRLKMQFEQFQKRVRKREQKKTRTWASFGRFKSKF
jgi:hypothetical protein